MSALVAVAAACGGSGGNGASPGGDAGADSTAMDSGGCVQGCSDAPGEEAGSEASSESGGQDSGGADAPGADASCLLFSAPATQTPAALLLVVDRSASMSLSSKWATVQQAIVQALDSGGFDDLSLGVLGFPAGSVAAPACLTGIVSTVECGTAATPQVAIANAGAAKSGATSGVRHDIVQYLTATSPDTDPGNTSPVYDPVSLGYAALRSAGVNRLALALLTDGGGNCASVSSPLRPGYSDGTCPDWEEPPTMNALIAGAQSDPTQPIATFITGLPGSDSTGGMQGTFATAPYSMLLALSTYAVSGSPGTVPAACDKSAVFAQAGAAPAAPCHFDLSQAASSTAPGVASAIRSSRERAFGCVYDLPTGHTIDPFLVNISLTTGGTAAQVPRRASTSNTCAASPCWDYDSQGRLALLGAACDAISAASAVTVEVDVGCATATK